MPENVISIIDGSNTIEIVEGDNVITLGIAMPVQGFLGLPPDGSFDDGEVTTWDENTTVAEAIDDLNQALKRVDDEIATATAIGTPSQGDLSDGYVSGITPDTSPADAVHALNVGLLDVNAYAVAPDFAEGVADGRPYDAGYIKTFEPAYKLADAILDVNEGLQTLDTEQAALADIVSDATSAALTPGLKPLGEPDGGFAPGYTPLTAQTAINQSANLLNQGLLAVSVVASGAANNLAATNSEVVAVRALAESPGQQPAKAPVGGPWGVGYSALGTTTPITDALNITNQGLLAVSSVAQAPGARGLGAPAGGWASGYASIGDATAINAGVNLLNAGLGEINTKALAAGDTADGAADLAQSAAVSAQSAGATAATALTTAQTATTTAQTASATATSASTTAQTATTTAATALTTAQAAGTAATNASTAAGQASTSAQAATTAAQQAEATAQTATTAAQAASTTAQSALTLAQTPGAGPLGNPAGGWTQGQSAFTSATLINAAINSLNADLRTASLAAATPLTTAPTDGSFADGLVSITAGAKLADSLDDLNEGALALINDGRTFQGLTLGTATLLKWATRSRLAAPADGTLQLTASAGGSGTYLAGKFATSLADSVVHFGNEAGTIGLAIDADGLTLKSGGQAALKFTTALAGTLPGTLTFTRSGTASDTNFGFSAGTGFYSPATNELAIATAGSQRVRIGATGLVGLNTDPVTGSLLSLVTPNILSADSAIFINAADSSRSLRYRNDGRLVVTSVIQGSNVVLGAYGNSTAGATSGGYIDFSNAPATSSFSLISATAMAANPTFVINAKSSAGTIDHTRWQQNGVTVATMANGGALSAPGFYANSTQAAAGTVAWGDNTLANGMAVNTTTSSILFRTNNTDALSIDNAQNQTMPAAASMLWSGRGGLAAVADGIVQVRNAAATAGTLQVGPSTSNGVRLAVSGGALGITSGTNSNSVTVTASRYNATSVYAASLGTQAVGATTAWVRTGYAASITTTGASAITTSASFPSGFMLVGVITLVTTTVTGTGLTGFNIGDTGTTSPLLSTGSLSATAFGANISPVSNAYVSGVKDCTVIMPRLYGTGTLTITLTPVGAATFTAGVVNVTYILERSI
jgi:hypothetical protein